MPQVERLIHTWDWEFKRTGGIAVMVGFPMPMLIAGTPITRVIRGALLQFMRH